MRAESECSSNLRHADGVPGPFHPTPLPLVISAQHVIDRESSLP